MKNKSLLSITALAVLFVTGVIYAAECWHCFHLPKTFKNGGTFCLNPNACTYQCDDVPECGNGGLAAVCRSTSQFLELSCPRIDGPAWCCGDGATTYVFECEDLGSCIFQ